MRTLLLVVCLISASVASAQVEIRSNDGRRGATAFDDGRLVYHSGNGTLHVKVTRKGLQIADVSIEATEIVPTPNGVRMRLVVNSGDKTFDGVIEVNSATNAITGARVPQLRKLFRDFATSPDGQLLSEARELISLHLTSGRQSASGLNIHSEWSTSGCGADVLNAVAAGSAMVAGCGAGGWWCASGVSWYGASIIQLATGNECIFM